MVVSTTKNQNFDFVRKVRKLVGKVYPYSCMKSTTFADVPILQC